jgi:hypothetical protein
LKYTISILLLILPLALAAQKGDTVKVSLDKPKKDFFPTGVRVGVDAVSLIRTQVDDSFSGYEFNADIDFYRYYLNVEMGKWDRTLTTKADDYSNSGTYMRVGIDVNFLKKDPDRNMFFIGARYGWGMYSETYTTTIDDPVWQSQTLTFKNNDMRAGWGELTTGLRVKMFSFFWMGYTARYKFGLNTSDGAFESNDVPGYGRTFNQSTWGFNYQLMFRIPVRPKK